MADGAARSLESLHSSPRLWRRLAVSLTLALGVALLLRTEWTTGLRSLLLRTVMIALAGVLAFSILERFPRRLPSWVPRWVLQVAGTGLAMPVSTLSIYYLSTPVGGSPFWLDQDRMSGFVTLTFLGILIAPWTALGALLRQREAFARHQALVFELERSELERRALDARLQLLRAQVTPHFLFNTLANVQALADSGSPRTPELLRSLTAYLRAAVPRIAERTTTLGDELGLVQAYLELMQMRMPDRLTFEIRASEAARAIPCPPITLLTLVENAVRHGIDPAEEGGQISITVEVRGERCGIRVIDTGVGLRETGSRPGTGLSALRERLQLTYGGRASLRVTEREAGGVCAELEIPAALEAP